MKMEKVFCVLLPWLLLVVGQTVIAQEEGSFSTDPAMNNDHRWRIGYFEGGEYVDYQKTLIETVKGLMKLGWIESQEIPSQPGEQTRELWRWLSTDVKSEYIEFVKDAHYSAVWDETIRDKSAEQIIQRLNNKQDIDLIIAMGTWAGKELANEKQNTPTMVLSTSDPLAAGIIKGVDDSGFEHVHATVDPNRYERQIKIFHDIFGFKRLGVAFENSVNGRSYAAIDIMEKVSQEKNFEIVRCHTLSDISDISEAEKSVVDCFEKLAPQVEAIYVTVQGGITVSSIPSLVKIANQYRIPTFSQSGSGEVKLGFLLSLSQAGFRYIGEFHASTFAKVFNGALPNQLSQFFEEPSRIAVNLKTAEIVGFNPPLLLIGGSDEVYQGYPEEK